MTHNTLENYYQTIFSLAYHFKMPMNVEDIIPYERDLYVAMIRDDQERIKEERLKQQARAQAQQSRGMF